MQKYSRGRIVLDNRFSTFVCSACGNTVRVPDMWYTTNLNASLNVVRKMSSMQKYNFQSTVVYIFYALIVRHTLDIHAAVVTRLGSGSAFEARSALPNARSFKHVMQECEHPFASSCQSIITASRRTFLIEMLCICC